MINSSYLYLLFFGLAVIATFVVFFNLKSNKTHINNKILLKNLLESFELELPDELKRLDNTSPDTQKLS